MGLVKAFGGNIKGKLTVLVDSDVLSPEKVFAILESLGQGEFHSIFAVGWPATSAGRAPSRARFPTKEFSLCIIFIGLTDRELMSLTP